MTDIAILRLHQRIDFLEDRMTDMEARVPGPINNTTPAALTRDLESLTAYAQRLETLINDIEKGLKESIAATDRARVRGDDAMHDLVTRTANSLYAEIKAVSTPPTPPFDPARIDTLETLINDIEKDLKGRLDVHREDINRLERAALSENENAHPQRDTSWRPFHPKHSFLPEPHERVVIFNKGGQVVGPQYASSPNWLSDVVAWRYANEGK